MTTETQTSECPDCQTPAETRTCADCGVTATVIDCGHSAQPVEIAASTHGGDAVCGGCEAARDAATNLGRLAAEGWLDQVEGDEVEITEPTAEDYAWARGELGREIAGDIERCFIAGFSARVAQ